MNLVAIDGGMKEPKRYRWREHRSDRRTPKLAFETHTTRLKVMATIYTPMDMVGKIESLHDAIVAAHAFYRQLPMHLRYLPSLNNRSGVEGVYPTRSGQYQLVMRLGWAGYWFKNAEEVQPAYARAFMDYEAIKGPWFEAGWETNGRMELEYGRQDQIDAWLVQECVRLGIRLHMDNQVQRIFSKGRVDYGDV